MILGFKKHNLQRVLLVMETELSGIHSAIKKNKMIGNHIKQK